MALTADKVIVEPEAKVAEHNRRITASSEKFRQSMEKVRQQAALAESRYAARMRGISDSSAHGL